MVGRGGGEAIGVADKKGFAWVGIHRRRRRRRREKKQCLD
jgi:hypothetical protein